MRGLAPVWICATLAGCEGGADTELPDDTDVADTDGTDDTDGPVDTDVTDTDDTDPPPRPLWEGEVSLDAGIRLLGDHSGSDTGRALAGGDLTGDGVADLIVGATLHDGVERDTGGVYVVPGPISRSASLRDVGIEVVGERAFDRAGYDVAFAADATGDGVGDLLIAGNAYGIETNRVWLVPGPITGPVALADHTPMEVPSGSALPVPGAVVDAAGDLDGDGTTDVVVVAAGVQIVHGPIDPTAGLGAPDTTLTSTDGQTYAYVVEGAGDVDGDGLDDLLAGGSISGRGAVWVHAGPLTGSLDLRGDAAAELTGDTFRFSGGPEGLDGADVDGDGYQDVVIADPNGDGSRTGKVYVLRGPLDGVVDPVATGARITAEPNTTFAASVAGAGDQDGDGDEELLVGFTYDGWTGSGGGWLVTGPVDGVRTVEEAGVAMFVSDARSTSGLAVAANTGDNDDDGIDDLAFGVPGGDGDHGASGLVYWVPGGGP